MNDKYITSINFEYEEIMKIKDICAFRHIVFSQLIRDFVKEYILNFELENHNFKYNYIKRKKNTKYYDRFK